MTYQPGDRVRASAGATALDANGDRIPAGAEGVVAEVVPGAPWPYLVEFEGVPEFIGPMTGKPGYAMDEHELEAA